MLIYPRIWRANPGNSLHFFKQADERDAEWKLQWKGAISCTWNTSSTPASDWFRCLLDHFRQLGKERCLKAAVRGRRSLPGVHEMNQTIFEAYGLLPITCFDKRVWRGGNKNSSSGVKVHQSWDTGRYRSVRKDWMKNWQRTNGWNWYLILFEFSLFLWRDHAGVQEQLIKAILGIHSH